MPFDWPDCKQAARAPNGFLFMAKVLLVESDPLKAMLRQAALEPLLGRVTRASDAAEALCLLEPPLGDFDLVVCGTQQSGLSGPAFVRELQYRRPRLAVLMLGAEGAQAGEYAGLEVEFLPARTAESELLARAAGLLERAAHAA